MGVFWNKIKVKLSELNSIITETNRGKAVSMLAYETNELENIFSLLVMGSFVGMPSPPAQISLELIPLMENEMRLMFNKVGTGK